VSTLVVLISRACTNDRWYHYNDLIEEIKWQPCDMCELRHDLLGTTTGILEIRPSLDVVHRLELQRVDAPTRAIGCFDAIATNSAKAAA
jgi:hypothetical protein